MASFTFKEGEMEPSEYQRLAERTESGSENNKQSRSIHAYTGMMTEVGELADAFKKNIYYGQDLDEQNLFEELGDILWYAALMCNARGFDLGEVMEANIDKLRTRYPDKFTNELAKEENRDREKEMENMGGDK